MKSTIYALIAVVAAAGLISATVTVTDAQKEKWAEIDEVKDGEYWMPFKDGMMIDETMPKFRGTSGGMESIQVTLNGEQVGNNNKIGDAGKWTKQQQWPLDPGQYTIIVWDCGPLVEGNKRGDCTMPDADLEDFEILYTATITVDSGNAATAEEWESMDGDIDELERRIAELEAMISELQNTILVLDASIAEILERITPPVLTPPPPPPSLEIPEQTSGQYYFRLLNSTNSTFGVGDRIHFEGRLPACPEPLYGTLGGHITDVGGQTHIVMMTPNRNYADVQRDCNTDRPRLDMEHIVAVFSPDHSTISGYMTVHDGMRPGEHALYADVDRGYRGGEWYSAAYYTEKFTLG